MGRRLKDRDYTGDLSALGRIGKRVSQDEEIPKGDREKAVKGIQTAAQVLAKMIGKETGEDGEEEDPSKEEAGKAEDDGSASKEDLEAEGQASG